MTDNINKNFLFVNYFFYIFASQYFGLTKLIVILYTLGKLIQTRRVHHGKP
jgi:hypothetical protein